MQIFPRQLTWPLPFPTLLIRQGLTIEIISLRGSTTISSAAHKQKESVARVFRAFQHKSCHADGQFTFVYQLMVTVKSKILSQYGVLTNHRDILTVQA